MDQNSSTACTSSLQRWHKPKVEGISPCPVYKTRKVWVIVCQLYEATKVDRTSKLQGFLLSVQNIDPDLELIQTCNVSKIAEGHGHVETRFGGSTVGSFGCYQHTFQESNFKVMCNIPVNPVQ